MAALILTLTLETDAVGDAMRELQAVAAALAGRHGAMFRALDRRIDKMISEGEAGVDWNSCFALHTLEPGREIMVPAGELMAVLNESRRLKVMG